MPLYIIHPLSVGNVGRKTHNLIAIPVIQTLHSASHFDVRTYCENFHFSEAEKRKGTEKDLRQEEKGKGALLWLVP